MGNQRNFWTGLGGVFKATKTAFGFVAIVLIVLSCVLYGVLKILCEHEQLFGLVPIVLAVGSAFFILIVGTALTILILWPEKLMLGEVKAEVFVKLLKLRQGDNDSGEVVEEIVVTPAVEPPQQQLIGESIGDAKGTEE